MHLSGETFLCTDRNFFMSPAKTRQCPSSLNVFREMERDTTGWEERRKRMLLTFPFGTGTAECHAAPLSLASLLDGEKRGQNQWLRYSNTAAGDRSFQTPCANRGCGRCLWYLCYCLSTSYCPSFLPAWSCSLLLEGLCVLLCAWPPSPGPWLFHQLFSNNLSCQST